MKRIWTLASKDFLETRRDRLALLFTVVMPLAFTAFFGLMFGGGSDRLPLAISSADHGAPATQLVSALARSGVVKTEMMTKDDAEKAVDDNKVAAALEIPAGFSAALAAGRPAELTLVSTAGSSGAQTVQTEVSALAGPLAAGERAAQAAVAVAGTPPGGDSGASAQDLKDAALLMARPLAAQSLAQPVATVRVVEAGTAAGQIPNGFVLSSPGMLVNFILFSLLTAGIALIQERRNFTLQRLMTTRVRRWELIAGKAVGMFALTFVQQIILIGAGQLLFGVDYLRDPAALLLMMVALSLFASTLGLLLAAVLSSEQAMIATTVIVSMSVAALSGAWFPLEITGPAFQFVGHLLPTAWILDGLRGIIVRGFGVADVLPAFGVALAWSAALFALAVWRFRLSD
ncbi:MAG: ABC transporter permease [Actinobacteria bacterium]|nr:ABC transporter permease [Actinomycetota bacterium]